MNNLNDSNSELTPQMSVERVKFLLQYLETILGFYWRKRYQDKNKDIIIGAYNEVERAMAQLKNSLEKE